jgi:2-C-methyl-D-erythritol 4-phosphate cytidylyltransferase/2-C-methyl-D-erythritol 2,4-cyclodiphosphate synthase
VLRYSLETFAQHPAIDGVRVVIHRDDLELYEQAARGLDLLSPVEGGATRQDSVRLGLESLGEVKPARVLIHDAARPFADAGRRELTDDAAVAEAAGLAVGLVQGAEENFKVTTEADLSRAERLLAPAADIRCGNGYDVHRFGPGNQVMLCGIAVPHDQGLEGHSDADVGLHALTDAILGAIGAGDIGQHFPPSNPRWRGADSSRFLAHAASLLAERGGRLLSLDVTLICERPKVGPHRAAMVARIAEILHLERSRVSVKATTTEGLGFTGRREGIAAQATATVAL